MTDRVAVRGRSTALTWLALVHLVLVGLIMVFAISAPIAFDDLFMADMLFLANLGWRGVHGLQPVIDYPHFYGGTTAWFMTTAFQLFGASYKSIYFGYVLAFAFNALAILAMAWRRLSLFDTSLLLLTAAAVSLTFTPIERPDEFVLSTVGHAYFYNHVGIVLMLALSVHVLDHGRTRNGELASSLLAAVVFCVLIYAKTTFAVFGLGMLVGYAVRQRWLAAAVFGGGVILLSLAIDPGWVRLTGSLEMLMHVADADDTGVISRIGLAISTVRASAFPLLLVAALIVAVCIRRDRRALPFVVAAGAVGAAYCAAILTMAGLAYLRVLPLLVVVTIFAARELALEAPADKGRAGDQAMTVTVLGACLVYTLAGPALIVAADAWWSAVKFRNSSLVQQGPMSDYVVDGSTFAGDHTLPGAAAAARVAASSEVLRQASDDDYIPSESALYLALADGVTLLQAIPDVQRYGIIGDNLNAEFTVPLQSRPVASFPVWPSDPIIERLGWKAIPGDIDMVMLSRNPRLGRGFGDYLRQRMNEDFIPCRQSPFWTLHVRRGTPVGCQMANTGAIAMAPSP